MANKPFGCLSIPLLPFYAVGALVGGVAQITQGPAMPAIAWERIDQEDRPAIQRARASAEGCLGALQRSKRELGPAADAVATEMITLFRKVCAVAEELSRARRFVKENNPDAIVRERADVEVRQIGAAMAEKTALDAALKAMEERGKHARTVDGEIGVLNARLMAAVATLETLNARLTRASLSAEERTARVEGVLDDLKAQQAEAERALQAYAATAREIAKLS